MIVDQGKSIEKVIEKLAEYENCKIIAGGTDIIIDMRNKKISPDALIDISNIDELKKIEYDGEFINIGSGVTFTQIVEDEFLEKNLYGFKKACRLVGSPQIRNKGTIGGNIANSSPAADSIPPLLCLDSKIILESVRGIREIELEDYYKDNIVIEGDELLTTIRLKKPRENQILNFAKLGLRKALAISRISIATLLELGEEGRVEDIKVASGSIGRYPMREPQVEEFLLGKKLDEDVIDNAVKVLQKSMDERLAGRSTLPYKRRAVESILKEALEVGSKSLDEVIV